MGILVGVAMGAGLGAMDASAEQPASWVEVGFFDQFESDLDDDGRFDVVGGYGRGQFVVRLSDDVNVRTLGSYYGSDYEFDGPPTIAGSSFKPWNTIHVGRLNPLIDVRINDQWRVFAGPLVEASFENGADLGNGIKPGGLIGAEMRLSPELKIGFGILGVEDLGDVAYIQPLLLLDWQPNEKLSIHAESWTTRGGRIDLAYRITHEFELGTSLEYRRERFRLKERNVSITPPPPVARAGSKGIGEDRAVVPAVRVSYLPDFAFVRETVGSIRLDVEVGVALAGDLSIEDRNGGSIQTMNYDPAPTLGIKLLIPL
jgi:hypothetical protein